MKVSFAVELADGQAVHAARFSRGHHICPHVPLLPVRAAPYLQSVPATSVSGHQLVHKVTAAAA